VGPSQPFFLRLSPVRMAFYDDVHIDLSILVKHLALQISFQRVGMGVASDLELMTM